MYCETTEHHKLQSYAWYSSVTMISYFTYHGSNSWIMLSKRIIANKRLANPTMHARDKITMHKRDWIPNAWFLTFRLLPSSILSISNMCMCMWTRTRHIQWKSLIYTTWLWNTMLTAGNRGNLASTCLRFSGQ